MPMPASDTIIGIIHIEMPVAPARSNDAVSIRMCSGINPPKLSSLWLFVVQFFVINYGII